MGGRSLPLGRVYVDLCGPVSAVSKSGRLHSMNVFDDLTVNPNRTKRTFCILTPFPIPSTLLLSNISTPNLRIFFQAHACRAAVARHYYAPPTWDVPANRASHPPPQLTFTSSLLPPDLTFSSNPPSKRPPSPYPRPFCFHSYSRSS